MTIASPGVHRRRRVALYSHDTVGLGHLRRNLAIAGALVAEPDPPDVLVICSASAGGWEVPHGVDFLVLPAIKKHDDGAYGPRRLRTDLAHLVHLRAATIEAGLAAFQPDLLIVDKVPAGVFGELEPTLARLRDTEQTRTVLGLRDILDDPAATRREWTENNTATYVAGRYDEVWVYGDDHVNDLADDLGLRYLPGLSTVSTGYVARPHPPAPLAPAHDLCLLGGGQDGHRLAAAFLDAAGPLPKVLVTGPQMPAAQQADLARRAEPGGAVVHTFVSQVDRLIADARRVVAMGGYNTTVELLAAARPSLLVPRTRPRREQLVRATRLAALGLVDVLLPDAADAAALGSWLQRDLPARPLPRDVIDLDGLERVVARTAALLSVPQPPSSVEVPDLALARAVTGKAAPPYDHVARPHAARPHAAGTRVDREEYLCVS